MNKVICSAVSLLVLCSICESSRAAQPAAPAQVIQRLSAEESIKLIEKRCDDTRSVVARLNVTLRDNVKDKDYSLLGAYVGDDKGNVRLRLTSTGEQLVADVGAQGEDVEISLPRKDRFYRGPLAMLFDNPDSQLALLAHACRGREFFFPRPWRDSATDRKVSVVKGRDVVSVFAKPENCVCRMTLKADAPVVECCDVLDKNGKKIGIVEYSEYKFAKDKAETSGTYPCRVTIRTADGKYALSMQVSEFMVNEHIPTQKYKIPVPEDSKVVALEKALKDGGELWD